MNPRRAALTALALAVVTTAPAHANLVVNGGFEATPVAPNAFATLAAIPGWVGAPTIEIQNHVAGSPYEGNQFVELDTNANSGMFQDLSTIAGTSYRIHFQYSPRPGVAASSNGIQFLWNDALFAIVALSGTGLNDTVWSGYDLTAVATGPLSRIGFYAVGISDSLGGYLDNVVVTAVPEPGTLQVMGLGLVLLATVSGTRRRRPVPLAVA